MGEQKVVPFQRQKTVPVKRRPKMIISMVSLVVILTVTVGSIFYFSSHFSSIDMIYYEGLNYVTRADVLTLSELREQPSIRSIDEVHIVEQLKTHPLIETANVKISNGNDLVLTIVEKDVLGCIVEENAYSYVLSDGKRLDLSEFSNQICQGIIINVPNLAVNNDYLQHFINELLKVNELLVATIQDINYEPLAGDDNRFSLYLKDGHTIKVNTYSMVEKLAYYETMKQTVIELQGADEKGIFHLDVGDFFEPYPTSTKK